MRVRWLAVAVVLRGERHVVEVDASHEVLELAVDAFVAPAIVVLWTLPRVFRGFRRHGTHHVGACFAVHVAVFGVGFRSGGAHFPRADAFERVQRLAHEFADGGVLFRDRLLESDRVDLHGHPSHVRVGAEAQRCHHQAHTQIVVGAHAGAFGVGQFRPCAAS